jgi:hypothetical protein
MLADEIEHAKQRELIAALNAGESAVAQSVADLCAAPEFKPGDAELLQPWLEWCRDKSVRHAPAKPWAVAAYVLDRHKSGVAEQKILHELAGIQLLHDHWRLPSPVTTAAVNAALEQVVTKAPRSWRRSEQWAWHQSPPAVKAAVSRRHGETETKIRQLQNEAAELKKQLEQKTEAAESAKTEEKVI